MALRLADAMGALRRMSSTTLSSFHIALLTAKTNNQPCKVDYSDVYDIMSFFAGPPDGRAGGHDDLAREISEAGKKFGEEHWRWEDMQAYMLRLLLEWVISSVDRQEAGNELIRDRGAGTRGCLRMTGRSSVSRRLMIRYGLGGLRAIL